MLQLPSDIRAAFLSITTVPLEGPVGSSPLALTTLTPTQLIALVGVRLVDHRFLVTTLVTLLIGLGMYASPQTVSEEEKRW